MLAERLLKGKVQARFNMVEGQLRPNGIDNPALLHAFESVPMEAFIPSNLQSLVYTDMILSLGVEGRWLLTPLILAQLLQLATIQSTDKVLVIGCGTGYSLAIISKLCGHVVGLENDPDLAKVASSYVEEQSLANVDLISGIFSIGYPKGAPYDVIVMEGAVCDVPLVIRQQLAPHGRLLTIRKSGDDPDFQVGKGIIIKKEGDDLMQEAKFDANCPYLPEFEPPIHFHF